MTTAQQDSLRTNLASTRSSTRFPADSPFQAIADHCLPVKFYKKGNWITIQGDFLDCLYIVKEGRVLLTRLTISGREVIFGFATAGEFFGDVPLFGSISTPYNALAVVPTTVFIVRKSELRLLLEDASSCRALIKVLAGRCDDAWTQIEALGSGAIAERIRAMLLWLSKKIGVSTPRGVEIKMTQNQLAQMIGSSRETLNRQINILKREGLLSVTRQSSLLISNPGRLAPTQHAWD